MLKNAGLKVRNSDSFKTGLGRQKFDEMYNVYHSREKWRDQVFRIGEFSKLTQVSVRMLRYYDETGLLRPAEIDAWT